MTSPLLARIVALPLLALALAAGSGCTLIKRGVFAANRGIASANESLFTYRSEAEPTTFAVAGPVAIDVESFGGDVIVIADPELTEARVALVRRAVHGYGRGDEAKDALANMTLDVALGTGELGQSIVVRTACSDPEPHYLRADVEIRAPEVEGIRIRTRHGDVSLREVSGMVDVVTDGGDVRLLTTRPMTKPVSIINNGGAIDYRIRAESTGAFDCQAVRGAITPNVKRGRLIVHPGTDHDTLLATLNDGANPVLLRAADGSIRLAVVKDPLAIGMFIDN